MMEIFSKIDEVREYLRGQQCKGKSIGFVPTMGCLHRGHLSLIRKACADNDICVVSIFVNPTQFGPNEDFGRYPRNFDRDREMAQSAGASVIFHPEAGEMYPDGYQTTVEVKDLTRPLCGASRPGYFRGVATVVLKLFNIVRPDKAYFGQKDAQQAVVVRQMVRDLNCDTDIVVCPIIRESDGLALSSRNIYLSGQERGQAAVLFKSLETARVLIEKGERESVKIKDKMYNMIRSKNLARVEYLEIVDFKTLDSVDVIAGNVLVALAVRFGATRLIDNIVVEAG